MSKKSSFRQRLFLGFFCGALFVASTAHTGELLPNIEARRFESTAVQKSNTGRVYLFRAETSQLPKTGSILLAHDAQKKPVLAFRVIRTDPSRSEYIAKKIRRYDQTQDLDMNQSYLMMEKVADIIAAPRTESDQPASVTENTDVPSSVPSSIPSSVPSSIPSSIPSSVPAQNNSSSTPLNVETFDADLDSSTAPATIDPLDQQPLEEDFFPAEVEETQILNPFNNSLGAMIGVYRNLSNFNTSGGNFGGFSLYYGHVLGRDLFVIAKAPQDAINIELGLGFYSIQNQEPYNDSYTVVPLVAQLRYDLQLSASFAFLFYGGIQYNYLASNTNGIAESANAINGIQPALGLGMLFALGPHWLLRTDLGWDKMAVGLTLEW